MTHGDPQFSQLFRKPTVAPGPPVFTNSEDLFQPQGVFKYKPILTQKQKLMKDVSEIDTADIKQF